jgi:hypothetical protein
MGFSALTSGLSRRPGVSSTNRVQASNPQTVTWTLRDGGFQAKDLFRIEDFGGDSSVRVGAGGLGGIAEEGSVNGPSLVVTTRESFGSTSAGGYVGAKSEDGAHELYLQAVTDSDVGAGPHVQLITGIGRPSSEYWYTEVTHKHNYRHVYAEGIESFSATQKHAFFTVYPTDDGAGNITFIYQSTIDWQTGRTIFNPGTTFPATYTATVDVRAESTAPALRVLAKSGGTGDLLQVANFLGGPLFRIGKEGHLMTRMTSAPTSNADIANSEMVIWLQDGVGAGNAFLQIKAKDSAGNIRNGNVPLT